MDKIWIHDMLATSLLFQELWDRIQGQCARLLNLAPALSEQVLGGRLVRADVDFADGLELLLSMHLICLDHPYQDDHDPLVTGTRHPLSHRLESFRVF